MLDGLETGDAKARMISWLMEKGTGSLKVNYKLRDWLFSRQRYWGEPFPLLHEIDAAGQPTGRIEPLDPSELPLELPELADFRPSGRPEPPLGKATEWNMVERNGRRYRRELNTMPQWEKSPFPLRPRSGTVLDASRPVCGWRGARGSAPALLAILA
jgi:leucyl-tRNA synthetase